METIILHGMSLNIENKLVELFCCGSFYLLHRNIYNIGIFIIIIIIVLAVGVVVVMVMVVLFFKENI
jgi:hypothetical protein